MDQKEELKTDLQSLSVERDRIQTKIDKLHYDAHELVATHASVMLKILSLEEKLIALDRIR